MKMNRVFEAFVLSVNMVSSALFALIFLGCIVMSTHSVVAQEPDVVIATAEMFMALLSLLGNIILAVRWVKVQGEVHAEK